MKQFKYYLIILSLAFSISCRAQISGNNDEGTMPEVLQVDTIALRSKLMDKDIKNVIVLPAQYYDEDTQEDQYPVVFLLHGYGDNYTAYTRQIPELSQIATDYNCIFVCPDGSKSWYCDSPIDKNYQYESSITNELLPFIDYTFITIPSAKMCSMAGLSIGVHT